MSTARLRVWATVALVVVGASCSSGAETAEPTTTNAATFTTATGLSPTTDRSSVEPTTTAATTSTSAPAPTVAPTTTLAPTTTVASERDCGAMTTGEHAIDVEGVSRTFEVVAPELLSRPASRLAPVVVLFHGFASTAANIIAKTGLGALAPASGVVLVAPQAVGEPTGWHIGQPEFRDGEFTDAVLAQVRASQCIDPDAIWLAGFSAGSAWTGVYGCSHTEGIAGLLMHSGLAPPICPADSTPDIYIVHGVADPVVPFSGGSQTVGTGAVMLQSVPESAAGWASTAGCGADPSTRTVGGRDTITTWTGCHGGRTVMLQAVADLGHFWSGGSEAPGTLNPGCVLVRMLSGADDPVAECAATSVNPGESPTESS